MFDLSSRLIFSDRKGLIFMEKKEPPPFNTFPSSAKKGIVFLLLAWASHFLFIYIFFEAFGVEFGKELWLQQSIIALVVCFFTIRVRNWARVLSIVCSVMIIVLYLFVTALFFKSRIDFAVHGAANAILFSLSTFFLFLKDTSDFFKLHSPRWGKSKSEKK